MTIQAAVTRTRTSLPTWLCEQGIQFTLTVKDSGQMVYTVDGHYMTHSEVAEKFGYTSATRNTAKILY